MRERVKLKKDKECDVFVMGAGINKKYSVWSYTVFFYIKGDTNLIMDSPIRDIIDRFSKLSRVTLVHTFRSLKNCSSIDFEIASLYINI